MAKKKKKCPICNKGYNDYLTHIWGAHKKKTIAYLKKKRKNAKKKPKKKSKRVTQSNLAKLLRKALKELEG